MLFGSKVKLELYIEFETADPRLEVLFMYTNLGGCAVMSPKYSSDTELKAAIGDLVLCIGTVFQIRIWTVSMIGIGTVAAVPFPPQRPWAAALDTMEVPVNPRALLSPSASSSMSSSS